MQRESVVLNVAIVLALCLSIGGLTMLRDLSFSIEPPIFDREIRIIFNWPNASPRVIEDAVTSRLEATIEMLRGVKSVNSLSQSGRGSIAIRFKDDIDLDHARLEISNIVKRIYPKLPKGVSYPQISSKSEKSFLASTINVSSANDNTEITEYVESRILPIFKTYDFVKTEILGETEFAFELQINQSKRLALKIEVSDIESAITNQFKSVNIGFGRVVDEGQTRILEIILTSNDQKVDIENIPVKNIEGRIIRIRDLGVVRKIKRINNEIFRINGLNTIKILIFITKGTNSTKRLQPIYGEIKRLTNKDTTGFHISIQDDTQSQFQNLMEDFSSKTIFSVLLPSFLLLIFYRSKVPSLILILNICITLTIACIPITQFNITLHQYSFPAISFFVPMLACNMMVLFHYLPKAKRNVGPILLAMNISLILIMATVMFISEGAQMYLVDFSKIVIAVNSVSVLVMLTVVYLIGLNKGSFKPISPWLKINQLSRIKYTNPLIRNFSWIYIAIVIIGIGIPIYKLPTRIDSEVPFSAMYNRLFGSNTYVFKVEPLLKRVLGGSIEYFSGEEAYVSNKPLGFDRNLNIRTRLSDGGTITDLNEILKTIEGFVTSMPEIDITEYYTSVESSRNGLVTIRFSENEQENRILALKAFLESKLIKIGGIEWAVYGVGEPFSNMRVNQFKTERIVLKGYNYDQLFGYAVMLKDKLEQNNRVIGADIIGSLNQQVAQEYEIQFKDESTAMHSISKTEILTQVQESFANPVIDVNLEGKSSKIDVISKRRNDSNNSEWFLLNDPQRPSSHRLSQISSLRLQNTARDIVKENQEYKLSVMYEFLGPSPLARDAKKKIMSYIKQFLPLGYYIGTEQENTWREINRNQYLIILIAIIAIFFVAAVLLESLRNSFLLVLWIGCSFVGEITLFRMLEIPNSTATFMAAIVLFCFVVILSLPVLNELNFITQNYRNLKNKSILNKCVNSSLLLFSKMTLLILICVLPFTVSPESEFWYTISTGLVAGLIFLFFAVLLFSPRYYFFRGRVFEN